MSLNLLRAGTIYGAANVIAAGVPFLLLPILTRALTPREYGVVVGFFLLVTLSNSVAGLNVHSAVSVTWFSPQRENFPRFAGSALVLAIASTAVCATLLLAAGAMFHERLGLDTALWPLAGLLAGTSVIVGLRATLWQSQQRALPAAAFQIGTAVLNMTLSLFAVLVLAMGGTGRVLGAVGASTLAAAAAVFLLRKAGDLEWACSGPAIRKLLRFGVPLIPHVLAGALMASADRVAVAVRLGPEALGIYGTAAQIGIAMNVLGDALVKALSPWMYAQLSSSATRGRLKIVAATYALIPVWLLTAVSLWLVFRLFASVIVDSRYFAAIDLSIWFLLGGAFSAVYLNIAGLFFFTSKTEWLSTATVSSAVSADFSGAAPDGPVRPDRGGRGLHVRSGNPAGVVMGPVHQGAADAMESPRACHGRAAQSVADAMTSFREASHASCFVSEPATGAWSIGGIRVAIASVPHFDSMALPSSSMEKERSSSATRATSARCPRSRRLPGARSSSGGAAVFPTT